ncbi:glycine--tRNA ligase subunit alpha [Candidatus Bipolaricaulota bacterium]|nr:glycine--tRNA ligase subunit alpha [Candidatus Bipolaricaulota bacterium]
MNLQELITSLEEYWLEHGCLIIQPYDVETGAGTFNPGTFFGSLGPDPLKVGYVEPSRRPPDGRYGKNPIRVRLHHQYQVILKPPPEEIQSLYLGSLEHIGIDLSEHDVRFVDDNWESPSLGARGTGWEVWIDGLEITQFTYFQRVGGIDLQPVCVELAYGLERIATFIQKVESVYDLSWNDELTYRRVFQEKERQFSTYNFNVADVDNNIELFEIAEGEAKSCLEEGLFYPAYDMTLKAAHYFNILLARNAISVTEREKYIARIRKLAGGIASEYVESLEGYSSEQRPII